MDHALVGSRLGPWRVDRLLGSGGMGQVWLAHRNDGLYEGQAAIKLMRLPTRDAHANQRFAREGRLLGRLNHPHIARLLDAGVTTSGERYLVLEHVDGERIDTWCDQHQLDSKQRIALCIAVCQAVAHAHAHLVVHRDLKPSNIFVTAAGQVKLLDFGVAKLMADGVDGAHTDPDLTLETGAAMTPAFAAPEQLAGGAISTATDVYGLGRVLQQLVAGPAPLRRAVHGDLALVVAKATQADAADRYRSVPEFADDLQRVLDKRPVHARPARLGYRLGRYVQRHTLGVGVAMLMLVLVGAGVASTLVQRQHALVAAQQADHEAQRAVAVKHFLLDLFDQARASVRGGTQVREATVNDMLAAGADRIDHTFAAQPEIRDEVFQILVELYSDTGEPHQIISLARRRLAAASAAFGSNNIASAPAEVMLAGVLLNFGERAEAVTRLAHAQTLFDQAGDLQSIERARLWRWQGVLATLDGSRPPWAEHPLNRAVNLLRQRYADDDELLAALATLPVMACRYGRPDDALAAAAELAQRTQARHGNDNLYLDEALGARVQMLVLSGHAAEALPLIDTVLAGLRRHVGEHSPNVALFALVRAKALAAAGQFDAAEQAWAAARDGIAHDHAGDKRLAHIQADIAADIAHLRQGQVLRCHG